MGSPRGTAAWVHGVDGCGGRHRGWNGGSCGSLVVGTELGPAISPFV